MKSNVVLITGSNGLIGSEAVRFFIDKGYTVVGIDNNMRRYYFGDEASTQITGDTLQKKFQQLYILEKIDIRDERSIARIVGTYLPAIVIHTAAQPSHDWSSKDPVTDFSVNALATLYLLEACRTHVPDSPFIFTSTNKVYGENPNNLKFIEYPTRFDVSINHKYYNGINENMSTDKTLHTVFGVSKLAADTMVQEYGKYFGMKTACFRGGCLTGPAHKGVALHGFLSYLLSAAVTTKKYTIIGYSGKQVRDNIHSFDLVSALYAFAQHPLEGGRVYNIGGGRERSISVLEALEWVKNRSQKVIEISYTDHSRVGDHQWYISDVSEFRRDYPDWDYAFSLDEILEDLYGAALRVDK